MYIKELRVAIITFIGGGSAKFVGQLAVGLFCYEALREVQM